MSCLTHSARWALTGVLALLASTAFGPAGVVGQTVTVHDCSQCEIRLETVAILGGPDLPFEFGSGATLAVMSDGRYLTTPIGDSELAVFNADGEFERTVGQAGQGPGEFLDIRGVGVAPGDMVYVLQVPALLTRLTTDLRYIDRINPHLAATPQGWTIMPDGDVAFVSVPVGTGTRADRVSIIDKTGEVRTSFARAPRAYNLEDYNETVGFLSPSLRYGGLWFAKLNRYALHLFVDERATRTLVRDAEWFEPWQGPLAGEGLTEPKRSSIAGIAERTDGLVMVVVTVSDANWEQNRPDIVRGRLDHGVDPNRLPRRLMFDTIVEVIDPDTGELVGVARSDDSLHTLVGGDGTLLYATREDDIGRYRIYVYRVLASP